MSTQPPTDGSSSPEGSLYEVSVGFADAEGGARPLGNGRYIAESAEEARSRGMDEFWDDRLDAGGARAVCQVNPTPRYLVSEGWGHIFVADREDITRWVIDRSSDALVCAEVSVRSVWHPLGRAERDDLMASLCDNDVLDADSNTATPDNDYQACEALPAWATPAMVAAQSVPPVTPIARGPR